MMMAPRGPNQWQFNLGLAFTLQPHYFWWASGAFTPMTTEQLSYLVLSLGIADVRTPTRGRRFILVECGWLHRILI
ncbi:hypothetical protein K503DRAFT_593650 [Rhizopogon vinicolor AM-OR11-026]|uniref:Uncharacterized protein n=1 Tax=Rhizopogon vinicolor AM-OR11-026 TaxID=1314800 RepID=A0A1B7N6X4_9AGAM|nr:hypothetical protein K503DRAFT_593650 [Rhizopogon vinicolor AM-OR11-026]